jgi:hypothetical protein
MKQISVCYITVVKAGVLILSVISGFRRDWSRVKKSWTSPLFDVCTVHGGHLLNGWI